MFEPLLDGHFTAFRPKLLTPVPLLPVSCSAFSTVAVETTGNQIVTGGQSPFCFGVDVIQRGVSA